MSTEAKLSRRKFLGVSGVAGTATALSARSYRNVLGANTRINTAIIGCGSMGTSHLDALISLKDEVGVAVRGVCDVFETRALHFQDRIWQTGYQAKATTDYREIFEIPHLDYVVIATPEYWHSRITLDALQAGLHIYCEKPLTRTIPEAFQVLDKVRETGLKLQVGIQGMSDDSYASAYQAIEAGKIGPVVEAQIDYVRNHPRHRGPWRIGIDSDLPQPPGLDWAKWLGPAPQRAWNPRHFFEWRNYRAYSGGIATDLMVHRLTRLLKACNLSYPTRIAGMGGIYLWDDDRELPDNMEILAEYPAVDGITAGMTIHMLGTQGNARGNAHVIRGHQASLIFDEYGWKIVEEGSDAILEIHEKTGAEDEALHHRNLISAMGGTRQELTCPAELGVYGVVAMAGANQSWADKKMLAWDAESQQWRI